MESLMQEDQPQSATALEATIMDDPIVSLGPEVPECVLLGASVGEAIRKMQKKNIGSLLVVDGEGRLAGLFTERDVLRKVAGQGIDLEAAPVESFMTPNPTSLKASDPIAQALHHMAVEPGYRYIPLVDEQERPTGLISFRRIAHVIEGRA
jgi:CBS domain-containing protein